MRFYYIARGSLDETINHIITAHDLSYISDAHYEELYDLGRRAERTLNGYIGYVRRQKTGREMFGDKYVPDPSQVPQAPQT